MGLLRLSKIIFILVFIIVVSCDFNKEYEDYKTIKDGGWNLNEPVMFDVKMDDVSSFYNLFLNIRTDHQYAYRNLFVISKFTLPNKTVIKDTLEYEITDAFGNWLGSGLTDVRDNKLFFLENYKFTEKGIYQFEFVQAMRKRGQVNGVSKLMGIKDVGLRIEKSTK